MASSRFPIPQGTLDMLILQILSLEPAHGYAIARRLQQISREVVHVNQGSLYPALHRLEQKRWLKAEWRQSETGREAKFYSLTRAGHKQLAVEKTSWDRLTATVRLDLQRGGIGRGEDSQSLPSETRPAGTGSRPRAAVPPRPPRRRPDEERLERSRSPETGEHRVRRRGPRPGRGAGYVDLAMAGCARARRPLLDPQPGQELGLRAGSRRRARAGHRREHRHLLGRQHGPAPAARLPGRRAHRLGRDVLDQHRTRQPGRVGAGLSRLAGAERRVRDDGVFLRRRRCRDRRRRPRRVCQRQVRLAPTSLPSSARRLRRGAC